MTVKTLLKHIQAISLSERNMSLSSQDARDVAKDNGLLTNTTSRAKLTPKGKHLRFNGHGKAVPSIVINYHKLAVRDINKFMH